MNEQLHPCIQEAINCQATSIDLSQYFNVIENVINDVSIDALITYCPNLYKITLRSPLETTLILLKRLPKLTHLCIKSYFSCKNLNYLLHLTDLTLVDISNSGSDYMYLLPTLKKLKALTLEYCENFSPHNFSYLPECLELQSLIFKEIDQDEDYSENESLDCFKSISQCKKLEKLCIIGCNPFKIENNSLKYLATLKNLRELVLERTQNISDNGFECITKLINLEKLHLDDCHSIRSFSLINLKKLSMLRELNLSSVSYLSNEVMSVIGLLENLIYLQLENGSSFSYLDEDDIDDVIKINSEGVGALSQLQKLETLKLSLNYTETGEFDLPPNIRYLEVDDWLLNNVRFRSNSTYKLVEEIKCWFLNNNACEKYKCFPNLIKLELPYCSAELGIIKLSTLTKLRELKFYHCDKLSQISLNSLASLRNITTLCFEECSSLDDTFLAYLKGLDQLKILKIYCRINVSDVCLVDLRHFENLEELYISIYVKKSTELAIKNVFSICTQIKKIFLGEENIFGKFIGYIFTSTNFKIVWEGEKVKRYKILLNEDY